MKFKKLFLLRHAAYSGNTSNPQLSEFGIDQARHLGRRLAIDLNGEPVTIWSSSSMRAKQTAHTIEDQLPNVQAFDTEPKLWSDASHMHDFNWLKKKLSDQSTPENLIIVSHLEYVQDFPKELGLQRNGSGYAEGILIEKTDSGFKSRIYHG